MTNAEEAYAYCENEMWYGCPCGTEGCPHCGGDRNYNPRKEWYGMEDCNDNQANTCEPACAKKEPQGRRTRADIHSKMQQ
jgi:hypothetical protein